MSFVGRLRDMPLPALLRAVGESGKSGRLTISTGFDEGLVLFRSGRVIYAASTSVREALGSVLCGMGLLDQDSLAEGLRRQHHANEERRLGAILVSMGVVTQAGLEEAVRRQLRKVITDLRSWEDGYFCFRRLEIPDQGEVEVDWRDLQVEPGVTAEQVIAEPASADGSGTPPHEAGGSPRAKDRAHAGDPAVERGAGAARGLDEIVGVETATLGTLLQRVVLPSLTAEAAAAIVDAADATLAPWVLFLLGRGGATAVASSRRALDIDREGLWLPLDDPSLVRRVAASRSPYRGGLERTVRDRELAAELGDEWPGEVVGVPALVRGEAALIVVGVPRLGADTASLESAMRNAGNTLARELRPQAGGGNGVQSS